MPLVDVWRFATTMSGAQCVMTIGMLPMPKWSVDSWDLNPWVSVCTNCVGLILTNPCAGHISLDFLAFSLDLLITTAATRYKMCISFLWQLRSN